MFSAISLPVQSQQMMRFLGVCSMGCGLGGCDRGEYDGKQRTR
ncbi:hypothetical protein SAMN05216338_103234 [Bradyrhizobium sp. Rc2d]|nr:hypothetical protein SAMN05216338_103234 [Bradyrhizobium sp. Rc2d]